MLEPATPDQDIASVAAAFGVTLRTLRFYEDRGLLQPRRTAAGRRMFDAQQIARVALIRDGVALGFSLRAIAAALPRRSSPLPASFLAGVADDALIATRDVVRAALAGQTDAVRRLDAELAARAHATRRAPTRKESVDA